MSPLTTIIISAPQRLQSTSGSALLMTDILIFLPRTSKTETNISAVILK